MAEQKVFVDTAHPLRIQSSLKDKIAIRSLNAQEGVSQLSVYHLELIAYRESAIKFDDIVGQVVTVDMDIAREKVRHFNGIVTEFVFTGSDAVFDYFSATVRPWFWFLTRTADCKIFQEKTVPDIILEVFRDNGVSDFDDRLTRKYRTWEYCVQYRESDFNFISRLMENEGIYYWFEHSEDSHILILADDASAVDQCPQFESYKSIGFGEHKVEDDMNEEFIEGWTSAQAIQPDRYAVDDYNFKKPKVDLLSVAKTKRESGHKHPFGDPEVFDYPGEFQEPDDGKSYVDLRMEELRCQHERMNGDGYVRGLVAGGHFKLVNHPREDQNKEYLVLSVTHQARHSAFSSSDSSGGEFYRCQFEVLDKKIPFRAPRVTPKPIVQGPQTAVVVGPESEEIYTDPYGRVKVQFHWDRYGQKDENSSCFIRVSQAWAGAKWGGMHIPRIKQEVIVSFLEGDPDQPIITGRVYNEDQMPPYTLEACKTQSGIKSRSTPGGSDDNFNEIRMEDKIGNEELFIQAEKNETINVKNDKTETVGNNETISIGNDRKEDVGHDETRTVGNNETVTIGKSRTDTVMMDETRAVMNNRTRTVAKNESVTVTLTRSHTVGINEAITVGGAQEIMVGGMQETAVAGLQSTDVGASRDVSVALSESRDVGRNWDVSVGKNLTYNVSDKTSFKVGKDVIIDAGDSITLKCGKSKIVMGKNGNLVIMGKNITFKAKGKITGKASSNIKFKGSAVGDN